MLDNDFPEALQIEVTNKCNFNCQMCIRRVWEAEPQDLNLDLYKKITKSSFPLLKKLILYGLGEPFVNPNFPEMLRIAKKHLPKDSTITISTNGSLLTPTIAQKILKQTTEVSITFSVDTLDMAKLSRIREGSEPTIIMKNFQNLAEMKGKGEGNFKLGVEVVVMKDNFRDLPQLVTSLAEKNVDYIIVSHVVPYTEEIFRNSIYVTLSKPSFDIIKPSLKYGWDLISEATRELLGRAYGVSIRQKSAEIIMNFWKKAEEAGYWINLPLLFDSKDKIETIDQVEEIFLKSAKIAYEYQMNLKLPSLFPDAKTRSCPYVNTNTMVVRSDGIAVPCLEFMYPHSLYINMHLKKVFDVPFGDLRSEKIENIWSKEAYTRFRSTRRNFAENIPWCGDCPYSTLKCFFTETNQMDCFTNMPACSECVYSVNLAQCNI
jgi:MoaA/NifB/PqqE/SkfB family radical SAM enzyme